MSFGDAFYVLTFFYFGLSLMVVFLNKPVALGAGGDAH